MKSNIVKGSPVISPRTRETMMLGEVPICVISPPSSEPNAIGIRNMEGDTPERLAIWKAIGIMIASAPMFFTKADSTVTISDEDDQLGARRGDVRREALQRRLHDAGARDRGADDQRAADDDDDVVGEAGEGVVRLDDPGGQGRQEGACGDEVVAEASPDEGHHHPADDRECQNLIECHGCPPPPLTPGRLVWNASGSEELRWPGGFVGL